VNIVFLLWLVAKGSKYWASKPYNTGVFQSWVWLASISVLLINNIRVINFTDVIQVFIIAQNDEELQA
jgi:hypothetical protein